MLEIRCARVVFNFEDDDLVAEAGPASGRGSLSASPSNLTLVGHDVCLSGRKVSGAAGFQEEAAGGMGFSMAEVEMESIVSRIVDHEVEIGADAIVEQILEEPHTAVDLGVVEAQGGHHLGRESRASWRP